MSKFKIGDVVRLKPRKAVAPKFVPEGRQNHKTATVDKVLKDTPGGIVTDRDLNGCRYWNEDDLFLVHNPVEPDPKDDALKLALEVIRDCRMPPNFHLTRTDVIRKLEAAIGE